MNSITATAFRKNQAQTFAKVRKAHEPLTVSHPDGDMVVLSRDDWESWQETLAIMAQPDLLRDILDETPGERMTVAELTKHLENSTTVTNWANE